MKLKYIFKISKKTCVRDILQIFTILVLFFVILFEFFIGYIAIFHNSCDYLEARRGVRIATSSLNQVLLKQQKIGNTINYGNLEDFARIFAINLPVIDVKYLDVEIPAQYGSNEVRKYTKNNIYSPKEIEQYKLQEYVGKPIIIDARGELFIFTKFEKGCKNADRENLENASCLIDVDIDGLKNIYNRKEFNIKQPDRTDRYTLIVDGNRNAILPAKYWEALMYDRKHNEE